MEQNTIICQQLKSIVENHGHIFPIEMIEGVPTMIDVLNESMVEMDENYRRLSELGVRIIFKNFTKLDSFFWFNEMIELLIEMVIAVKEEKDMREWLPMDKMECVERIEGVGLNEELLKVYPNMRKFVIWSGILGKLNYKIF